jgi:hypothetical protein
MNEIRALVPTEALLREANGDTAEAMRLAALFGYGLAVSDLDEACLVRVEPAAEAGQ